MSIHLSTLYLSTLIICAKAAYFDEPSRPPRYNESIDNGTFGYYPTSSFMTEEDIFAPKVNWLQWDPQCNDGTYYFLTPRGHGLPRPGPMILDWKGDLVWKEHFANEWGGQAYDFMVQRYQGQDYLTFWTGDDRIRGHGSGSYMMLDSSYEAVHTVNAANGLNADLHEFLFTPDGTALMTVYQKYQHDISDRREFSATKDSNDEDPNWIWDCLVQEIAIDTKNVIFEWRASDHIDVNDTYHVIAHAGNFEDPFDWFHLNSIRKDELGNYLISARYTHSITYIDGKTGEVIWILGGKSNMFMDLSEGSAINFAWQHDAQFVSPDSFLGLYEPPKDQSRYTTRLLSLFDNAAEDQNYMYGTEVSRGLLLEITFPTPGYQHSKSGKSETDRDISHLRKLAEKSNALISLPPKQTKPNLLYPSYTHDTLQASKLNRQKIAQTNSTNPSHTARIIQIFTNPSPIRSSSQGSLQILPPPSTNSSSSSSSSSSSNTNARILIGYGLNALFTEFASNGTPLCDAHFGAVTSWERGDIQSYRAYKFPWVGRPKYAPKVVLDGKREKVYVSWNGATEVRAWLLQVSGEGGGSGGMSWRGLQRKRKVSFETDLELPQPLLPMERYIRLLALDAQGEVLEHGISEVLDRYPEPESAENQTQGSVLAQTKPAQFSSQAVLLGGFLAILTGISLFEAYRRYLCWKVGRPSVGAVRWRKGAGYV